MDYFGFVPKKIAAQATAWLEGDGKEYVKQGLAVAAQFEPPAKRDLHYVHYEH